MQKTEKKIPKMKVTPLVMEDGYADGGKTVIDKTDIREEFEEKFVIRKYPEGDRDRDEYKDWGYLPDEVWKWFKSKLTKILESVPCEEKEVWKTEKADMFTERKKGYNQHCSEIKAWKEKIKESI